MMITTTATISSAVSRSQCDVSGALTLAHDASDLGRWLCLVFVLAATGC